MTLRAKFVPEAADSLSKLLILLWNCSVACDAGENIGLYLPEVGRQHSLGNVRARLCLAWLGSAQLNSAWSGSARPELDRSSPAWLGSAQLDLALPDLPRFLRPGQALPGPTRLGSAHHGNQPKYSPATLCAQYEPDSAIYMGGALRAPLWYPFCASLGALVGVCVAWGCPWVPSSLGRVRNIKLLGLMFLGSLALGVLLGCFWGAFGVPLCPFLVSGASFWSLFGFSSCFGALFWLPFWLFFVPVVKSRKKRFQ